MNYNTTYFIDTYIDNMFFSRSESFFNKELCKVKFRHLSNSLNTTNPHKSPYFSLKLKALIDLDKYEKYAPRPGILPSPFTYTLPVTTPSIPKHSTYNVNTGPSFVMSNLKTQTSPNVSKTNTTAGARSELKCPKSGINPFAFGFLPSAAKEMIVKQHAKSRKVKNALEQTKNNTQPPKIYGASPFGFGVIPNNIKEIIETQKKEKEARKKAIEMAKFLGRQFIPKNSSVTTNTETTINSNNNSNNNNSNSNNSNNCSNTECENDDNDIESDDNDIESDDNDSESDDNDIESDDNDSDRESILPINYNEQSKNKKSSESGSSLGSGLGSEGSSISGSSESSSSLGSEGSYISSDISGDEVNIKNPSFMDMAASLFVSQNST